MALAAKRSSIVAEARHPSVAVAIAGVATAVVTKGLVS